MSEYAGRQFVGIDLHRRRTVWVRTTDAGEVLVAVRVLNDVDSLNQVMARAGEDPEVVLEATYGWYWAVDALQAAGARVHLAHPLGVKAFEYRRVKNDFRDAADLADLLRMGRLPEAWIAPPATRELRELVRHRAKLVGLRSGCKAEVHAVLAKCGIRVPMSDLFGLEGTELLDHLAVPAPYGARVQSLQRLIEDLEDEIDLFARLARGRLVADPGYIAVQQLPGVGPILAAVFVAEVGDVTRFAKPTQLASWAGLTPKHHESDTHVHRGRITKQGSRLVRWAAVESVKRIGTHTVVGAYQQPGRRPAWEERRHRGRGPQADRVRLLRAARPPRPSPVPARQPTTPTQPSPRGTTGRGGGMRPQTSTTGREAAQVMTPARSPM